MALFEELKRRNVIRVATLYVVAGWLVLQVADLLFGLLGLPDWSLRLVLGTLLLGFPIAVVFSWVFEVTPEPWPNTCGSTTRLSPSTAAMPDQITSMFRLIIWVRRVR